MINTNIFQSIQFVQQLHSSGNSNPFNELHKKISSIWSLAVENLKPPLQRSLENIKAVRLNFSWSYAAPLILFALCVGGAYYLYHWWTSLKREIESDPSAEISAMQQEDLLSSLIREKRSLNVDEADTSSIAQSPPPPYPATLFEELARHFSHQRSISPAQAGLGAAETENTHPHGDGETESTVESEGESEFSPIDEGRIADEMMGSFELLSHGVESSAWTSGTPLWKQKQEEVTVDYIKQEMCRRFDKSPEKLKQRWILISKNNQELIELNDIVSSLLTPETTSTPLNGFQVKIELLHALGRFYNRKEIHGYSPEITEFIHSLVGLSMGVPLWKYFEHIVFSFIDAKLNTTSAEPGSIVDLLEQDFTLIGGGRFRWLEREFNKACGALGVNFAPNLGTNYFSILWNERYSTREGEIIEVPVYRFGTPTQDDVSGNSSILPVFKLWIDVLQAQGKRHCYFGHQHTHGPEGRRTDALIALSDEREPFFMFNLPIDGSLYQSKESKLAGYFKEQLLDAMLECKDGFYFPIEKIARSLPHTKPEQILRSCISEVWENFFVLEGEGGLNNTSQMTPDQQRTFILLTYVKIEQYFSSNLRASRNSTCKDGIDRAAIVNTLCYYLGAQATARAGIPEEESRIINETRVVLHHAALFVKGQAVIKSRRTDLLKAMQFLSTLPEDRRRGSNKGDIALNEIAPITSEFCVPSHDDIGNFIGSLRRESPTLEHSLEIREPLSEIIDTLDARRFSCFSSLFFRDKNGEEFQGSRESILQAIKKSAEAQQFLARISAEEMIDEILKNIRRKFCIECGEESIDISGSQFRLETLLSPEGNVKVTCRANIKLLQRSSSPDYEDEIIGEIEVELGADSTKSDMNYRHTLRFVA